MTVFTDRHVVGTRKAGGRESHTAHLRRDFWFKALDSSPRMIVGSTFSESLVDTVTKLIASPSCFLNNIVGALSVFGALLKGFVAPASLGVSRVHTVFAIGVSSVA